MARVSRGVTAHARHNKVLRAAKGYYGRRKIRSKQQSRLSIKRVNMHIEIVVCASVNSELCGFSGLMRQPAYMVCPILRSWAVLQKQV